MYRLTIENVGKIKSASVQLGGLTVLTGFNDIGKSTIGKVAWCLVETINQAKLKYLQETDELLRKIIGRGSFNIRNTTNKVTPELDLLINDIRENASFRHQFLSEENIENTIMFLKKILEILSKHPRMEVGGTRESSRKNFISQYDEEVQKVLNRVNDIHSVYNGEPSDIIYAGYFNDLINRVFRGQLVGSSNNTAEIIVFDETLDEAHLLDVKLSHQKGKTTSKINVFTSELLYNEVTFVDSPLLLNLRDLFTYRRAYEDSQRGRILGFPLYVDLVEKIERTKFDSEHPSILFWESIDNFSDITNKIAEIIKGKWQWSNRSNELVFSSQKSGKEYYPVNVSSGIKAFGVLQLLAEADLIRPDSLLILDEPESNLHPEWEVKFGELLVWLATQGIPIIVSTHSSYVLQAIYKYADRYGAEDLVSYYVGEMEEDGIGTVFTDVTDNVSEVFHKNSVAMQKLLLM